MKKIITTIIAICFIITPFSLFAQIESHKHNSNEFLKVTKHNFGEVVLTGETQAPSYGLITSRSGPKFKAMIKSRANFNFEIYESVDNL